MNRKESSGFQVSEMRIELTRPNGHYPLKVARLPIPPPGQGVLFWKSDAKLRIFSQTSKSPARNLKSEIPMMG